MKCIIQYVQPASSEQAIRLERADTFLKRFCGLMMRKNLEEDGLLLLPCGSVHTCFMRFPIDVLYLDKTWHVIGKETLRPWRVGTYIRGTKAVIELAEGAADQISVGEKIYGLEKED